MEPYGRVIVLQLTILPGAIVAGAMGSPVGVLILLVALKTGLDVLIYRRQHRAPATG